jgi:hypothetical protein
MGFKGSPGQIYRRSTGTPGRPTRPLAQALRRSVHRKLLRQQDQ